MLVVDNQELTEVNIFTSRKNNTNSFPHIHTHSPMYTLKNKYIHTQAHFSKGKLVSKLKNVCKYINTSYHANHEKECTVQP